MKYPTHLLILSGFFLQVALFAQSVQSVEKVSLTVSALDRAVQFYTEVLEFKKAGEYSLAGEKARQLYGLTDADPIVHVAILKMGDETLELLSFENTAPGRVIPADSRSNDGWFQHIAIVVSDMDAAYKRLLSHKVTHVSTAPQTLPDYLPAAAGISAFYFRDPDGHNLELIHFPPGKGHPRWQAGKGRLFLGIDHTAIGIEDTDKGYAFWRDALKLEVGGHSENYGTEQEHLNQVFGARLFITGLHAGEGFGVEFLDYIAPPGGRPYPADSRPTDLWHWHTTLEVDNLDKLKNLLLAGGFTLVSTGIVALDDHTRAILVRDPDGHAVLLKTTTNS